MLETAEKLDEDTEWR